MKYFRKKNICLKSFLYVILIFCEKIDFSRGATLTCDSCLSDFNGHLICLLESMHVLIIILSQKSQKVKQNLYQDGCKIKYGILTILETSLNIKLYMSHHYYNCQILSHCYI